ncbi:MAG TPA: TetR family transcriptional regulator [Solirubrobacteraceae bacterium]|nr:TetR family transcriptional regulator [Solirubrobacteraceae bacterium]
MAEVQKAEQRGPRADALRSVDAILLAAREVLAEDAAAGIDAIAARAGVHRATLYRHFATREALISGLYEAYLDDAEATILETDVEPADALAEVEALTRRVYEVNLAWRAFAWAPAYSLETQARRSEMAMTPYRLFQAAHAAGVLRPDLTVRDLLAAWGAPVLFLASRISEGGWTLDEVVAHTMRLLTPPR